MTIANYNISFYTVVVAVAVVQCTVVYYQYIVFLTIVKMIIIFNNMDLCHPEHFVSQRRKKMLVDEYNFQLCTPRGQALASRILEDTDLCPWSWLEQSLCQWHVVYWP